MAHEHVAPGPCVWCSIKHLGAAKVRIGEGLASSDPARMRARLLDATFELNEAESTHLSEHPNIAQKVRKFRKRVEETALGHSDERPDLTELNDIIQDLAEKELEKAKQEKRYSASVAVVGAPSQESPTQQKPSVFVVRAHEHHPPIGAVEHHSPTVTPETVKEAVNQYNEEYKAPASVSDVQFLLTIPHGSPLDREIDKALAKAPEPQVKEAIEVLKKSGHVRETPDGGYVDPPVKPFNILKPKNNSKMALTTSDVGYVVGSSFAAKGTEVLVSFADEQLGLSGQPPHGRLTTWVPPILGALLVVHSYMRSKKGQSGEATLAEAVYGSHLLAQTVDDVEALATTGASGFVVRKYQAGAQPVQTTPTGRSLF